MNNEGKYRSDQQFSTLFGLHFKGIETEFEIFKRLMTYYDAVERICPGANNRGIRKFLKTGDFDLLQSIPEIDNDIQQGNFSELVTEIERIESMLSRLGNALEKLASLTSGLKNSTEIAVDSLIDLADGVDTHLRHKAMNESDGAARPRRRVRPRPLDHPRCSRLRSNAPRIRCRGYRWWRSVCARGSACGQCFRPGRSRC